MQKKDYEAATWFDEYLQMEMKSMEIEDGLYRTPQRRGFSYVRCVLGICAFAGTGGYLYVKTTTGNNEVEPSFVATEPPTRPAHVYPGYYRKPKSKTPSPIHTPAPTPDLSVLPENASDCIESRERLLAAVDAYLWLQTETNATAFPLSNWCINGEKIQDFSRLFDYNRNPLAGTFNEPLNDWNMAGAVSLAQTFQGARLFNQPLDQWDTSKVLSLRGTFFGADAFNQPLSSWDTSNCVHFGSTFRSADDFNQELATWDVSKAKDLSHMFDGAKHFQQDLCSWVDQLKSRNDLKNLKVQESFTGTACPSKYDPLIHLKDSPSWLDPRGPFCFPCNDVERRLTLD